MDDSNAKASERSSVLLLAPRDQAKAFAPGTKSHKKETDNKDKRGRWFLFFGVILPLLTVAFELTTRYCAQNYFDPFPSSFHVGLFCLIPLSNFLLWLSSRRDLSHFYGPMSLLSGMVMGIGCLYTLMFLPITPGSALYVLTFGFGLLGLAPLLSLPCSWMAGKTVCQLAHKSGTYFDAHQVEHIGHLIVLVMVIAVELPSTLTRVNISQVISGDAAQKASSVDWLRRYGNQEVMQRACLERSGKATDIIGTLYEGVHPIPVDKAREVFYKVTGKAYNSVPIPASFRATIKHNGTMPDSDPLNSGVSDEFDLDADVAGATVSGMARGLSQAGSKFTGKVDSTAAIANIKWTLSFKNTSKYDREVRTKIQLPPGAVISRATLKIGNVERVATIKAREEARALYQAAVVERKNPLLVSYTGKDQVLVQCFPVEPGADVQLNLALAIPLYVDKNSHATCLLPYLAERNFVIDKEGQAICEFISTDPGKTCEVNESAGHQYLSINRDMSITEVVSATSKNSSDASIVRTIGRPQYPRLKHLQIIVDGSISMQPFMSQIAEALNTSQVILDTPTILSLDQPETVRDLGLLAKAKAQGGQDNTAALVAALSRAVEQNGKDKSFESAVLWVHGAQPIKNNLAASLHQMLNTSSNPILFDLQVADGPCEALTDCQTAPGLVNIVRTGTVSDDLTYFIDAIEDKSKTMGTYEHPEFRLSSGSQTTATTNQATVGDVDIQSALTNIWCGDEIRRMLMAHSADLDFRAAELANLHQVVTPISSAIVYCPDDYRPVKIAPPLKESIRETIRQWQYQLFAPFTSVTDIAVSPFKNAFEKAMEKTVSQLNCLSSAAGSAGYDGTASSPAIGTARPPEEIFIAPQPALPQSQDYEAPTKNKEANLPNAPTEVSDAFGSANMADSSYGVSSYGGGRAAEQKLNGPQAAPPTPMPTPSPTPSASPSPSSQLAQLPMPRLQAIEGLQRRAKSELETGESGAKRQSGDEFNYNRKKDMGSQAYGNIVLKSGQLQDYKQDKDAGYTPVLQGATSGTIMPTNGLIGAPVDPRYGQSNEVAPGQSFWADEMVAKFARSQNADSEMGPLRVSEFTFLAFLTAIVAALYGFTQWLTKMTNIKPPVKDEPKESAGA
ncbi:MAG: hypothetical protein QG625_2198 [Cyanobacteriota bacterium erpe_2018_sw_39hr_WHONDRS-SW48-000098_B_bin.30]|nr:hypothetical protein [Candidatus Obscuribacter sp.]MDQ5966043.1 hypothetical protein [Cyanobacteriota bacterium erpe_2018_sw_39hr_WHONDRS-SW48-000098_B_bin.30]